MLRSSKVKVTCFYCNKATYTPKHPNGPIRRFECPLCNATNHFDEKGEIVDVVPTPGKPAVRYAYERKSPTNRRIRQEGSVCCRSCETNHSIIVQQLSNYLPDESDPNYEYLAEHISEFRRQLEEKYPPLCADCAPKVNERLRHINYKAKTQGLGRLLQNTNKMVQSNRLAHPKSVGMAILDILIVLGWYAWGVAYWASIALLMFWQLTVSIVAKPATGADGLEHIGWETCLKGSLEKGYLNSACYFASSRWVSYIFPWALLLSFYDYKWLEVRNHPGSYVEDRVQYLFCQAIVSAFMALSWWFLGPGGSPRTEKEIIVLSNSCLLIEFFMVWTAFTSLRVTHPVQKISLREGRPVMPSLLSSEQSASQESHGGMAFRPAGPSINDHIRPARTNPSTQQIFKPAGKKLQPAFDPQSRPPPSQQSNNIFSSFSSAPSHPSSQPSHPSTQLTSEPSDPDAMDWNPIMNSPIGFSKPSFNSFESFSQHRPSSPLGFGDLQDEDGNTSEEEDAKTEVNDSPARFRGNPMRPKSLLIDGLLDKQTGLESLFEVAAKLDEAKPMNQPGILIKRAHRIGQEAARLLAVSVGLVVLVSSEGTVACAGLLLAVLVGTCWRFANATFRNESLVQSVGERWKRNFAVFVCLLEVCGSVLVSSEMLGFHVLSGSPGPSLLQTVDPLAVPVLPDGSVDISASPQPQPQPIPMPQPMPQMAPVAGQTQLVQLIIRVLFFSLAAHQTWDFAQVFAYRGTQVMQPDGTPLRRRKNSRDLGVSEPLRRFVPPVSRESSFSDVLKAEPTVAAPVSSSSAFGGLSLGGGGGAGGGRGSSLTQRSNFSSWGAQNREAAVQGRDVGIRRPQTQRFGATTTRSMKVAPAGTAGAQNPWTAPPPPSSSAFQQPRGGAWGQ
ncbi:hypothetical protein Dda_8068 [Drechslerella dactyloides]|uniref:Ima1 N-terminal domain-containing protein n=1 Tax=Drechslerella dactyloides TaxID=74499 RepID=A0AAD6NGD7_DREDA|nr:hypothetical protein Dda_8068 [Drechslerella dactyloides]